MMEDEFLKSQYLSLREEIKESKGRMFKTLGFGLTVTPVASVLSFTYKIDFLMILIPLMVLIVGLLYLADSRAVMRCGSYIKEMVEQRYANIIGWEEWLYAAGQLKQRSVDIFLTSSFYLLFIVYYISSVSLAVNTAHGKYGILPAALVLGMYAAVGVAFAIFLLLNFKHSTQTARAEISNKARETAASDQAVS